VPPSILSEHGAIELMQAALRHNKPIEPMAERLR